ncbi:hypothetical protein PAPYR_10070 [Paratrimastix pyriformis]|uniref:Uncharacterized protein n=1 Tax=Paratrimastix pyriformis TaxID=342808 RepID=A0ABQ8U6T0_9EUKA|nr:hypothetical protein PAPYR_10070 [Paratrimastix pyriformis]
MPLLEMIPLSSFQFRIVLLFLSAFFPSSFFHRLRANTFSPLLAGFTKKWKTTALVLKLDALILRVYGQQGREVLPNRTNRQLMKRFGNELQSPSLSGNDTFSSLIDDACDVALCLTLKQSSLKCRVWIFGCFTSSHHLDDLAPSCETSLPIRLAVMISTIISICQKVTRNGQYSPPQHPSDQSRVMTYQPQIRIIIGAIYDSRVPTLGMHHQPLGMPIMAQTGNNETSDPVILETPPSLTLDENIEALTTASEDEAAIITSTVNDDAVSHTTAPRFELGYKMACGRHAHPGHVPADAYCARGGYPGISEAQRQIVHAADPISPGPGPVPPAPAPRAAAAGVASSPPICTATSAPAPARDDPDTPPPADTNSSAGRDDMSDDDGASPGVVSPEGPATLPLPEGSVTESREPLPETTMTLGELTTDTDTYDDTGDVSFPRAQEDL